MEGLLFIEKMKNLIKKIIESDELAGDILRVLSLFNHVLWESEVRWEIQSMNSTLNTEVNLLALDEKLSLLMKEGVIIMEKRIKGSVPNENPEENLIKLVYPVDTIRILLGDDKFKRYVEARKSVYEKFLRR